jgi:hypothetical protein
MKLVDLLLQQNKVIAIVMVYVIFIMNDVMNDDCDTEMKDYCDGKTKERKNNRD